MIHLVQAKVAFIRDRENVRFYEITRTGGYAPDRDSTWVGVMPIGGKVEEHWVIGGGRDRLEAVLARTDVTRRNGNPLAVGNSSKGVFGIAVGPETPPDEIGISVVLDLDHQRLIAAGPGQPEWWLFEGHEEDPWTHVGASGWRRG